MGSDRTTTISVFREFRRGLITPGAGVLGRAAVVLVLLFGALSFAAHRSRELHEKGDVELAGMRNELARVSTIAVRGAERETDPSAENLVFVGPSALRCWLPEGAEADAVASDAAGSRVHVVKMCANRQSYAVTAALVDRFGPDFDGWFVIGAGRQVMTRELPRANRSANLHDSAAIGFESATLRREAANLNFPQSKPTGWEFWDRRFFHISTFFGLRCSALNVAPYNPYFLKEPFTPEAVKSGLRHIDEKSFARRLAFMKRLVESVRVSGRVKIALVDAPWVDSFESEFQDAEWKEEEAVYRKTMEEWSAANGVPFLTPADDLDAGMDDFSDPRHVATPELRRRFLQTIARDLAGLSPK